MKKEITSDQYQKGIFDICDSLVTDLLKFLKDEGRYKFRMIGYMKKIIDFLDNVYNSRTEEDIEICERVIYLSHKAIYRDYKRLRIKKLSPADSIICILIKLISISEEINDNNLFGGIKEILQGFYNNIKNKGKNDKLWRIENTLKEAIENKTWGKLRLQDLNIYEIEHPVKKVQELKDEKDSWKEISGKEIDL